jgi:hypothetical protein
MVSFSASLLNFSTTFGFIYAFSPASRANPLVEFFAWTTLWSWLPFVLIPLFFFPLFFPDGRLLSRRWRIVIVAAVISLFANIVTAGFYTDFIEYPGVSLPNSYYLTGGEDLVDFLNQTILTPLGLVFMIATIVSPILRYRRADGVQRAQMKWIFFTLMLGIAFFLSFGSLAPLLTNASEEELAPISNGLFWLFTIAIPIVMGVAILRYRLFDIDLIIRRTLVYGALTVLLAVIYLGIVTLLQSLVSAVSGQESPLIIVLSTLVIAALFAPLRRRVQRFIDRRFYRRKYDATQTLAQFATTARDEVDLDHLTDELVRVVDKTMQPESVSIWLKDR